MGDKNPKAVNPRLEMLKLKRDLLFRKNTGRNILKEYLLELNKLSLKEVSAENLLSVEETDMLKEKSRLKNHQRDYPLIKKTFLFNEKDKLKEYVDKLYKLYPHEIYLLTGYSEYCGCLKMESLMDFNIYFNFNDERDGIMSILSADLNNSLLLDYYEEYNEYYIELEFRGEEWSKIE